MRSTRNRCKCGFLYDTDEHRHRRKCADCGAPRVPKSKPKHAAALELPYEEYVRINGGEHCGICGAVRRPGQKRFHRDHDHRTGKPRGIACFPCNAALRPYMTEEWLANALEYLRRARGALGEAA